MNLRDFAVGVRGFDFSVVYIRARSHSRARMLCALAYEDAGFGTVAEGLGHVTSVRLTSVPSDAKLVSPAQSEGLLWWPKRAGVAA